MKTASGYEVISSERISDKPWFSVRREHVRLPTGAEIPDYFIFDYPDWINVTAITTDGEFVLIKQYRHGIGRTDFELPAGVCDPGDASALDAAKRELLEETGYGGGEWQLLMSISANTATHSNLTHCYLATGVELRQEQNLESTEMISVHLCSPEEVKELLMNNAFLQSLHAAPLWKYFCLINNE